MHRFHRRSERGSAMPLVILVMALGLLSTYALAYAAQSINTQARAQTAADAAALAGVNGGRPAVNAVAKANGAQVVAVKLAGSDATVTVRIGDSRATARAQGTPTSAALAR